MGFLHSLTLTNTEVAKDPNSKIDLISGNCFVHGFHRKKADILPLIIDLFNQIKSVSATDSLGQYMTITHF